MKDKNKGETKMTTATMTLLDGRQMNFEYEATESSFWQNVGKRLLDIPIPNRIDVSCPHGSAVLNVKQRGSYIENGIKKPSMFIDRVTNGIYGLAQSVYKKVYLTCIHPESNNYKAYILRPVGDVIYADYGSIDEVQKGNYRTVQTPYASYLYWIRYYEKLSKGYVDQSKTLLNSKPVAVKKSAEAVTAKAEDNGNSRLYSLLTSFAKKRTESILSAPMAVTERQVAECRKLWNKLGTYKTVAGFNRCLAKLLMLSPRKRNPLQDQVSRFFANDTSDFAGIIDFEESLILAMEGAIGHAGQAISGMFTDTEVYEANEKQTEEVMRILGNSELKNKVKRIWRVKPLAQEKRFANYCKANNIKTIKRFWHGSRNENWASIVQNGLLLNPNAVVTGKMFGQGIYFAPSPKKSFGYTSYHGSYWANGTQNRGFMGIYATAYGNPCMIHTWGSDSKRKMEQDKCNCVHATPANTGLMNDEVVFYDEAAIVMNYLVEFGD